MYIYPKQLFVQGKREANSFNNYFSIRWCVKLLECQFQWQRGGSVLNRAVGKYAYWEDGSTVVARKEKAKICMHSTK